MAKVDPGFEVKDHQLSITLPKIWFRLLRQNKIDNKKMALRISLFIFLTWPFQLIQRLLFNHKINKVDLEKNPPLFILGHWRSGTTHLHYIFARDKQFGYLSNYQAFLLNVALLGRTWLKVLLSPLMPDRRPQDNVKMSVNEPAEEEQPFTNISNYSGMQSFFFPKNISYHDKFNTFKGIKPFEKRRWKRHYTYLLKLISYCNGQKPLVLKNPHNTGRTFELLELFPKAKFVFIHRNPYEVYHSSVHLYKKMIKSQFLQDFSDEEIEERVFYNFTTTMSKYLEERCFIDENHLIEISFEELEEQPETTIAKIYHQLGLQGLQSAWPDIKAYLNDVKQYKKNEFPPLSEATIARINTEWRFAFDAWGYEIREAINV